MSLTPIKVRNKRKKPVPPTSRRGTLLSRGRPFKDQNNSPTSNTDIEGDSSSISSRKRRKIRHTRLRAPLENLPAEILQNIFFRSRNADLMFASKTVMHKLEKSEHVKLEFVFSTLFWPIINNEVDPDINSRPDLRHTSGDADDDSSSEKSLLAQAQSRLLSCRFFTADWFHYYMLKAYEKWNTLHAITQPERVVEIPEPCWGDPSLFTNSHDHEFRWMPNRQNLLSEGPRGIQRFEEEQAQRELLAPVAFHPSTLIPLKFLRLSTYWQTERSAEQSDIMGFFYYGLRLRMPVSGEEFDDLVRENVRGGCRAAATALLFLRADVMPSAPLPDDLLRIAVLEGPCDMVVVNAILDTKDSNDVFLRDIDLLDPALWAWADRNGMEGQRLKARLRETMDDD